MVNKIIIINKLTKNDYLKKENQNRKTKEVRWFFIKTKNGFHPYDWDLLGTDFGLFLR